VHEDVESDETELDRMLYLGGVMGSSSNNIMIKENIEEASIEEASVEDAVEEDAVEEASVEVPVQELQDILQLAGYENYAEKIEEYANEPDEEYGDAQEQMVGLSGGLNGPKTHYPAAAGGDNPMAVKALKVTDDVYEGFYSKYDKFVKEFNEENK